MLGFNKDSLETPDSSLYHCGLNPCIYCSSPKLCEASDATASESLGSVCPFFWKPIPQTEDEINEQLRLDYEEEEWWEEARSASLWCKEYFGHD